MLSAGTMSLGGWAVQFATQIFSPAPTPVPIEVTLYSTVHESDFGNQATEPATWEIQHWTGEDRSEHQSKFVKDFTSRTAINPKHPDLSGVALEGNGLIDPKFHQDDPFLLRMISEGFQVLALTDWDEATQKATFSLEREPRSDFGGTLVDRVSAAVSKGNPYFPMRRWVRIDRDGKFFEYRFIDDECSSCKVDQIDLYYEDVDDAPEIDARSHFTATVMPKRFKP